MLILLLTFLCRKRTEDAKNMRNTPCRIHVDTHSVGIFLYPYRQWTIIYLSVLFWFYYLKQSWLVIAKKCLFILMDFKGSAELGCRYLSCRYSKLHDMAPCNVLERPVIQSIYLSFSVVSHHAAVAYPCYGSFDFFQPHHAKVLLVWGGSGDLLWSRLLSLASFPRSLHPTWKPYLNPSYCLLALLQLVSMCNLHHSLLDMRIWLLEIHHAYPNDT